MDSDPLPSHAAIPELISSLSACAAASCRARTARFLNGLSADELEYIAEFLGACMLESPGAGGCTREQLSQRIATFELARDAGGCATDHDHKMIVLLEFLCVSRRQRFSIRRLLPLRYS